MSRRPARATQADIRRAVEAVRQAGVQMVVEILPNGTIRLVPASEKNDLDSSRGRVIVL